MKKLLIVLSLILFTQAIANANYNDIYIADIQYDWIKKTEQEKDVLINEVHDIVFENGIYEKQKDLKKQFKNRTQDKEYRQHYLAASAGYEEFKDYNISAFYYKKQKHIYMYALQDKKDLTKSFYYDALGKLRYIDYNFGEYPEYPYYTIQYSISGEPISAIYNVSKDNQYLYNPDGSFKGVWYKHNLYSKESKVILTRTTY
jgi:hypothetical protein